jgi:hypothetical protein
MIGTAIAQTKQGCLAWSDVDYADSFFPFGKGSGVWNENSAKPPKCGDDGWEMC